MRSNPDNLCTTYSMENSTISLRDPQARVREAKPQNMPDTVPGTENMSTAGGVFFA